MASYFPALYGNADTKERLGRAIAGGRLPHALILSGPRGSGRRTLAREIAAALVCEGRGDTLPCGSCENCRRVREGIFPDLHTVAPDEGKSLIPVAKIREMRAEMSLSAVESAYRIFIIEDAEAMNVTAQNALLVSLEEPPDGVVILLLTASEDALLSTVRSRAQTVRTELFDADRLSAFLASHDRYRALRNTDPTRAAALIEAAHGTIGEALALLEGSGLTEVMGRREATDAVIAALAGGTTLAMYDALHALPQKRDELAAALSLLFEALRDLILLKRDGDAPLMYYTDRKAAAALAEGIGLRALLALADAIDGALPDLERNANVPVLLGGLMHAATRDR